MSENGRQLFVADQSDLNYSLVSRLTEQLRLKHHLGSNFINLNMTGQFKEVWVKNIIYILPLYFCMTIMNVQANNQFDQALSYKNIGNILPSRQRVKPENLILKDRLNNLLPQLMREANIDMWLIINREYAEDKLFFSLVPQPSFAARRTTILAIFDRGEKEGLERVTLSRYPMEGYYDAHWEGGSEQEQWQSLEQMIAQRNPQRIGINYSKHWALSDGLTVGLYNQLIDNLSKEYQSRLVSAENLVIRWMETRTEKELQIYPHIVTLARTVISEAFSSKVITPGVTTTEDVAWYIRERFETLQLSPWFQPDVNIQRRGDNRDKNSPYYGRKGVVIEPGDILHTDVGICYLKLCTDTQEMGYVMKLGEANLPKGLAEALAKGNRWQDLLVAQFKVGKTGNQILRDNLDASKREGLIVSTYTHPIGFVGHAAGPTIGMWDNQGEIPIKGDWKLNPDTAYAIEGSIKTQLAEWDNEWIQIKLEQTAYFNGEKVIYLAGRQTQWHIVK